MTFAGLPERGWAFGTPLTIWATATAAPTRTAVAAAAPSAILRKLSSFRWNGLTDSYMPAHATSVAVL
jgi:hypothetical protein